MSTSLHRPTFLPTCISLNGVGFLLITPTPTQHHRVHPSISLLLICYFFLNSEKPQRDDLASWTKILQSCGCGTVSEWKKPEVQETREPICGAIGNSVVQDRFAQTAESLGDVKKCFGGKKSTFNGKHLCFCTPLCPVSPFPPIARAAPSKQQGLFSMPWIRTPSGVTPSFYR